MRAGVPTSLWGLAVGGEADPGLGLEVGEVVFVALLFLGGVGGFVGAGFVALAAEEEEAGFGGFVGGDEGGELALAGGFVLLLGLGVVDDEGFVVGVAADAEPAAGGGVEVFGFEPGAGVAGDVAGDEDAAIDVFMDLAFPFLAFAGPGAFGVGEGDVHAGVPGNDE